MLKLDFRSAAPVLAALSIAFGTSVGNPGKTLAQVVTCNGLPATIVGSANSDMLVGTPAMMSSSPSRAMT